MIVLVPTLPASRTLNTSPVRPKAFKVPVQPSKPVQHKAFHTSLISQLIKQIGFDKLSKLIDLFAFKRGIFGSAVRNSTTQGLY